MNVSTTDTKVISKALENHRNSIEYKYREDPEEKETQLETHTASFKLFDELDSIMRDNFALVSDIIMIYDDSNEPKTILVRTYTDNDPGEGVRFDELKDDTVLLGYCIETNRIDFQIGTTGCVYIDVAGPTGYLPAFNEKVFEGNTLYGIICDAVWTAMFNISNEIIDEASAPKGSTSIAVTESMSLLLNKWVTNAKSSDELKRRESITTMLGLVETDLWELYGCCGDWYHITPNNKNIDKRYLRLFLTEEETHTIKPGEGIDISSTPITMSMLEFSDEKEMFEITIGTFPIVIFHFKDGKPVVEIRHVNELNHDIMASEKYNTIKTIIKDHCNEVFGNNWCVET